MSSAVLALGVAARFPLLALAATWCALALGFDVLLVNGSEANRFASLPPSTGPSWSTNLYARGVEPCTGELVTVNARLTVEAVTMRALGRASTDATVHLASLSETPASVQIEPITRRFTPYVSIDSSGVYTHVLRAALLGPFRDLDLVVEFQGSVDDRGTARFLLLSSRIDAPRSPCSAPPSSLPPPPITMRDGLLPAA